MIAGIGLLAAGSAEALRPRRKLVLLRGTTIANAVPSEFDSWTAEGADSLVSPDQAGRLAKTLYSEIVQRIYHDEATGASVMLLAAYGDTQSDLLQLHRPESCYPAVGFNIESTKPGMMRLPGGANLPVRRVIATTEDRRENIVYWTRIGEELPLTGEQQRAVRLQNAMRGFVSDGILVRCSVVGDSEQAFQVLDNFVPQLVQATTRSGRPALIGTRIARQIA